MATVSDNFNGLTAGTFLGADANWDSSLSSGDRMQVDSGHTDTSDGTNVIDGSGAMSFAEFAVYQTALASANHETTLDCFPDSDTAGGGNRVGVVARSGASAGGDCYFAWLNTATSNLELQKRVSGSNTSLGTWTFTPDTSTVYELKLRVDGTTIEVDVDGVNRISVTDSSVTSGNYAGVIFQRQRAAANGQPTLDNFTASDIAGGTDATVTVAAPVTATGSVESPTVVASTNASVTASTVDAAGTVETVQIVAVTTALPAVITVTPDFPVPNGSSHVTVDVVTGDVDVLMPTASGSSSATMEPTVVDVVGSVLAATVTASGDTTVTAVEVTAVGSVGTVTTTTTSSASASPSVVTAQGYIGSVTPSTGVSLEVSAVTAVGSAPNPTVVVAIVITGSLDVTLEGVTTGTEAIGRLNPSRGGSYFSALQAKTASKSEASTLEDLT